MANVSVILHQGPISGNKRGRKMARPGVLNLFGVSFVFLVLNGEVLRASGQNSTKDLCNCGCVMTEEEWFCQIDIEWFGWIGN